MKFGGGRFGPEGSAGTLQRVDGALVCVAIKSSDSQTMDTRADAYRIYEAEISQAWRTP